jgi:hypothetical protein
MAFGEEVVAGSEAGVLGGSIDPVNRKFLFLLFPELTEQFFLNIPTASFTADPNDILSPLSIFLPQLSISQLLQSIQADLHFLLDLNKAPNARLIDKSLNLLLKLPLIFYLHLFFIPGCF